MRENKRCNMQAERIAINLFNRF